MLCNKCGQEVSMNIQIQMQLPAEFFRKLPKNFSSKAQQCWVTWEKTEFQCTHCGKMYKLEPTDHWKDTIEDLIFENETGRIASNNGMNRSEKGGEEN